MVSLLTLYAGQYPASLNIVPIFSEFSLSEFFFFKLILLTHVTLKTCMSNFSMWTNSENIGSIFRKAGYCHAYKVKRETIPQAEGSTGCINKVFTKF